MQKVIWKRLIIGLGLLILILLSTCVDDWPHYSVSLKGGYVTESGWIPVRFTWGEQAHIPLSNSSEFTVRSICYPRESDGNQHCHLILRVDSEIPINAKIDQNRIVAREPGNPSHDYVSKVSFPGTFPRSNTTNPILIIVYLDYERPPREFELIAPKIFINGEAHIIPPIRFHYEDKFPYQLVPWITNY
jgi:hypothetical protein